MLVCMKMVLNQNISDNNKNSCSYNITANPIRRKRKAHGVGNITNKKEQSIMKNDNLTAQGRETLERFKMEAANEVGVNLRNGYNGDLSAREAGSIGGMMVNMMTPEQQWHFTRNNVRKMGHSQEFVFIVQSGI